MIALAGNVDWSAAIVLFIVLLVSLTAHEAAHALVAKLGGDLTAYRSGQVTLNPLPHIQREPMGMVVVPLLSIYMTGGQSCIGFASAPIDPAKLASGTAEIPSSEKSRLNVIAIIAPSDAPAETPSVSGDASGLRSSA